MVNEMRESGIGILGGVPWGTHICHFYQSSGELLDNLVAYFRAGLENNERCVWVTSEPLSLEAVRAEMEGKVEGVDERIENGQLEILNFSEWYTKHGGFNAGEVVRSWAVKESRALKQGFEGLRVSGDVQWVGERDWKKFVNYEEEMNRIIGRHCMLALCTYPLTRCGTTELIDSLSTHGLTFFEQRGNWKLVAERNQGGYSLTGLRGRGASVIEDPNGHIVYGSSALAEMLGYQKREMLGAFWTQFVSPEYLERAGEGAGGEKDKGGACCGDEQAQREFLPQDRGMCEWSKG